MQVRVIFLVHDLSSDRACQMSEVLSQYLKRFSSYKATVNCDGKTIKGKQLEKKCKPELWSLCMTLCLDVVFQICEILLKYLIWLWSYRADTKIT